MDDFGNSEGVVDIGGFCREFFCLLVKVVNEYLGSFGGLVDRCVFVFNFNGKL